MKRLFTVVITLLLGASLTLAQDTGDKGTTQTPPKASGKKATKVSKAHKGGKKGKKGSGGTGTTPPPK
jgi:hypothetical protein